MHVLCIVRLALYLEPIYLLQIDARGDSLDLHHRAGGPVPVVMAARTVNHLSIDGRLDEPAWAQAARVSTFRQMNPNEGATASERTEVRVLYDDRAMYIGAHMWERDPQEIKAFLTRRDEDSPSDYFAISLDTYHDHRTSMTFVVNPLGVRQDWLAGNDQADGDASWDPVWEAATRVGADGWTVEMRIPFSQLRFARSSEQIWGVNFFRFLASRQEKDAFVLVKRTENGYASRFAHLVGIREIVLPRRVEFLPYARISLDARTASAGDPFYNGHETNAVAGLDLKYAVTSNLTLDATTNPDFGQVEADPAVLNLTAFETFFEERRPFFVEGSPIFNFDSRDFRFFYFGSFPQFFYSRRIGHAPELSPNLAPVYSDTSATVTSGPFFKIPQSTTILAAAKVTGRLGGGTSVGFLHAETAEADAQVGAQLSMSDGRVESLRYHDVLEPRSHYSVARFQQDFRGGGTTLGFIVTRVSRDLSTPRLDSLFRRAAYAGGIDWQHRWEHNRFRFAGQVGWSGIYGSPPSMANAQRSSARYYQRPDQEYVSLDTTRRSLQGYSAAATLSYDHPSGISVAANGNMVSPGFEVNDAGFLTRTDNRTVVMNVAWQLPSPTRRLQSLRVLAYESESWNTGRKHLGGARGVSIASATQSNWNGYLAFHLFSQGYDEFATRGGPLLVSPRQGWIFYSLTTDMRRVLGADISGERAWWQFGGRDIGISPGLTWRPRTSVQVRVGPTWGTTRSTAFYVAAISDTLASSTFGKRYVFAELLQRNLSLTARLNVTLSPTLSLRSYLELFIGSGLFSGYKELRRGGTYDFFRYGVDGGSTIVRDSTGDYRVDPDGSSGPAPAFSISNPNASLKSLRGIVVLRWEYRPGATFFAVWGQNRSGVDSPESYGGVGDLTSLFRLAADNTVLLKINYWLSK